MGLPLLVWVGSAGVSTPVVELLFFPFDCERERKKEVGPCWTLSRDAPGLAVGLAAVAPSRLLNPCSDHQEVLDKSEGHSG